MRDKRKRAAALLMTLFFLLAGSVFCALPVFGGAIYHPELLVDRANLLDEDEFEELNCKLFDISQKHQTNVAIVTISQLGNYDAQGYADTYYTSNQYGYENTNDGVLLLIAMDQRAWAISANGSASGAFTRSGTEYLVDHFMSYLSDGDYYEGLTAYADLCDDYLERAETGTPYDEGSLPKAPVPIFVWILDVLFGGALGVGSTMLMKNQLKSVRHNPAARQYIKKGSLLFSRREDTFLYDKVTMVRKPKNDDRGRRGGGGISFSSSSGHTGASGHF